MTIRAEPAACVTSILLALTLFSVPPAARASDARLDQACMRPIPNGKLWAFSTATQSFTPTVTEITAVAIKVGFVDDHAAQLTARLVFHPTGDTPAVGLQAPGQTVHSWTITVAGRATSRQWLTLELDSPHQPIAVPAQGSYAVEVDFPLDPAFPGGRAHRVERLRRSVRRWSRLQHLQP